MDFPQNETDHLEQFLSYYTPLTNIVLVFTTVFGVIIVTWANLMPTIRKSDNKNLFTVLNEETVDSLTSISVDTIKESKSSENLPKIRPEKVKKFEPKIGLKISKASTTEKSTTSSLSKSSGMLNEIFEKNPTDDFSAVICWDAKESFKKPSNLKIFEKSEDSTKIKNLTAEIVSIKSGNSLKIATVVKRKKNGFVDKKCQMDFSETKKTFNKDLNETNVSAKDKQLKREECSKKEFTEAQICSKKYLVGEHPKQKSDTNDSHVKVTIKTNDSKKRKFESLKFFKVDQIKPKTNKGAKTPKLTGGIKQPKILKKKIRIRNNLKSVSLCPLFDQFTEKMKRLPTSKKSKPLLKNSSIKKSKKNIKTLKNPKTSKDSMQKLVDKKPTKIKLKRTEEKEKSKSKSKSKTRSSDSIRNRIKNISNEEILKSKKQMLEESECLKSVSVRKVNDCLKSSSKTNLATSSKIKLFKICEEVQRKSNLIKPSQILKPVNRKDRELSQISSTNISGRVKSESYYKELFNDINQLFETNKSNETENCQLNLKSDDLRINTESEVTKTDVQENLECLSMIDDLEYSNSDEDDWSCSHKTNVSEEKS